MVERGGDAAGRDPSIQSAGVAVEDVRVAGDIRVARSYRTGPLMAPATRARSFRSALTSWPDYVAAVEADPSEPALNAMCGQPDVMDALVVRAWGEEGHQERLGALRSCRAVARQANGAVTAAVLARAQERGRAGIAARRARDVAT